MKHIATGAAAVLMAAQAAVVLAQPPDFSGTWKIDPSRSRVAETAALSGLVGVGAPPTLHVTQPANGTLVIESPINEGHARLYRPGGRITTPVTVGPAGSITMTSRWEGRALVGEGTREFTATTSPVPAQVKEVVSLSADGRTLTVEVTTTAAGDKSASTMVYARTQDVGPCQTWPTPCKTPSR
jgi:hypothetical protein